MGLVSIIVPVYNIQNYLGKCIESLLCQTFQDIEIILVDDGSTDQSSEICDVYAKTDNRIKVIHKKNGGLPTARNAGLAIAKGEWLAHVDGDDWVEPEMIETLMAAVDSAFVDVVVGGLRFAYDDCPGKNSDVLPVEWNGDKTEYMQRYMQSNWTCLCGTLTRRSLYQKYSLKSPVGITWQEDFHLIVRLLYFASEIRTIPYAFYNYRQRGESIMGAWSDENVMSGKRVIESTMDFFKEQNVLSLFEKQLSWRWFNTMQGKVLERAFYTDIKKMASRYRMYILNCPFLSHKRKAVYALHSFAIMKFLGIYRK